MAAAISSRLFAPVIVAKIWTLWYDCEGFCVEFTQKTHEYGRIGQKEKNGRMKIK